MTALAGTPLVRWHEPLVVGSAVVLFGLVYLMPQNRQVAPIAVPVAGVAAVGEQASLDKRTRDSAYYREQWARETARFYAANPPRSEDSKGRESMGNHSPVHVARLDGNAENDNPVASGIVPASHSESAQPDAAKSVLPSVPSAAGESALDPRVGRRWHVLTCLAAGLLASLAYVAMWPTVTVAVGSPIGGQPEDSVVGPTVTTTAASADERHPADSIQIHLPSQWVQLRPTIGQTVRRGVLGGSYLVALIGAWGVFTRA